MRQLRDALVQKQNDIVVLERRAKNAEMDLKELTEKVRSMARYAGWLLFCLL